MAEAQWRRLLRGRSLRVELPTLERSPERSVLESSSPVLDPIRYKIHLLLKELAANRELVLSLRSFMNVWRPPSTACRLHPDDKWASTVPNLHQFRAGYAWGTCSPQGVQPGFNTPAQKRAAHTSSTVESYTVPGLIRTLDDREIVTTALADYCAKYNFVSSEYATELMLPIDRCDTVNVTIGSSKIIQTLGTISTRFSFQGEDSFHDLTFHVLQDCLQKVVLGKPFLKASQTFSNAKNSAARIKRSVEKMVSRHHMFFLGESTPSFTGSVNGVHSRALADTGSNALVMDRAYARRNGIVIDPGPRSRLFFADGSQKYTRGIARGVKWRFGPGPDAEEHLLDFHILRNAPANIVLSDSFLFKTQAFSKYSDCLSDGEGQDEHGYLCLMTRDSTYNPKERVNMASISNRKHAERCLRGRNRTLISKLPKAEQETAIQVERERQENWQRDIDDLEARMASGQPQALADETATPALQPSSPPTRRSKFWSKLKHRKTQNSPSK